MSGKPLWRALAGLADATVALGYGAPGYRIRRRTWDPDAVPADLAGRVFVVTGANAGLGLAATRALAARGAAVHMVCRSAERGAAARDTLATELGTDRLHLHVADVSDLGAVRTLARALDAALPRLDALIHNAGALVHERTLTAAGLESTFATHVAGPFLLTTLLAPLLTRSAPARVVTVTSGGMYTQRLDLATLTHGPEPFDGVVAYAQAKRAQVILNRAWSERLGPAGVTVSAMHPGWADTGGVQTALPRFHRWTRRILRTPEQGADTAVWLAASPEAATAGGGLYLDRLRRREHTWFGRTRSSLEDEASLWALCERVTDPAGTSTP